ncbi:ribosomal protein L7/L12 C-terminal domain-containing protein [Fomitopsis serialis]|uniref:ribosomal protein L7/L12 C-terminal domain-containing protein n=1 Tax=Fomitopsis serialis TaxID=139415 RepID=UPI002008DB5C|nr:ribosomal protein L7/L12 C-terminal domain-containing protein [Neoantrodia serialis]KAH9911761.1 ribosomal protein L7/L12 C-terminal domain-containing protein [Neoantrodia serialis]
MATRCSSALRVIARTHRAARSSAFASSSRCLATAAATEPSSTPPPPPPASAADPKIKKIVDDISGLTLLQASDLVALLKSRLNIQEIAMPAAAAPAAAPAEAAPEVAEEKPKEKSVFTVKLESFEATAKPKIIREVKAMVPNLTLIEAKKFVESLPQTLKANVNKEDAEKLQKTFQDLGAIIKLE